MAGLTDLDSKYLTDTSTVSTTLPDWFNNAQQQAVTGAQSALSQAPQLANTAAQSAIDVFGSNSPYAAATSTLQSIGSGAANPWMVSDTGEVSPNKSTALGGLFAAQNDYFNKIMPDIAAGEDASAIAGGGFGSKMNQAGVAREIGKAYSDLAQKQQQAALQNQATGVSAEVGLGNVLNQQVQGALNTGTFQQNAPFAGALNLQNILQKSQLPKDEVSTQDYGLLKEIGGLQSLLKTAGIELGDTVNAQGQTVPGLLSKLGLKGGLGGLINKGVDWLTGAPDYTGNRIDNTAQVGEPGYGWKYYDSGIAIDPDGNYYENGELIWSPGWNNGDDSYQFPNDDSDYSYDPGYSDDGGFSGDGYDGEFEI